MARARNGGRLVARRAARLPARPVRILGWALRLAGRRGPVEPDPAVHHDDRRPGHPFPPDPLTASGRGAAADDPRLAGVIPGVRTGPRPADRPARARRRPGRRVRCGRAVAARLRVQRQAGSHRVGCPPHRPRLGRAHDPAGLRPVSGRGQRLGHQRVHQPGAAAPRPAAGHPPGAAAGAARPLGRRPDRRRARRAGRPGPAQPYRIGLLGHPGHLAADHRLLADRFTGRAVRLDRGEAVGLDRPPR